MSAYIKMTVITKKRKERRMSQKELADKAGLSLSAVQGYEQGRHAPGYEAVKKMCGALELPVNAVYEDLESYSSPLDYELGRLKAGGGGNLGSESGREAMALYHFQQLNDTGQLRALSLLGILKTFSEYQK